MCSLYNKPLHENIVILDVYNKAMLRNIICKLTIVTLFLEYTIGSWVIASDYYTYDWEYFKTNQGGRYRFGNWSINHYGNIKTGWEPGANGIDEDDNKPEIFCNVYMWRKVYSEYNVAPDDACLDPTTGSLVHPNEDLSSNEKWDCDAFRIGERWMGQGAHNHYGGVGDIKTRLAKHPSLDAASQEFSAVNIYDLPIPCGGVDAILCTHKWTDGVHDFRIRQWKYDTSSDTNSPAGFAWSEMPSGMVYTEPHGQAWSGSPDSFHIMCDTLHAPTPPPTNAPTEPPTAPPTATPTVLPTYGCNASQSVKVCVYPNPNLDWLNLPPAACKFIIYDNTNT